MKVFAFAMFPETKIVIFLGQKLDALANNNAAAYLRAKKNTTTTSAYRPCELLITHVLFLCSNSECFRSCMRPGEVAPSFNDHFQSRKGKKLMEARRAAQSRAVTPTIFFSPPVQDPRRRRYFVAGEWFWDPLLHEDVGASRAGLVGGDSTRRSAKGD
jgi:hypothetical protein